MKVDFEDLEKDILDSLEKEEKKDKIMAHFNMEFLDIKENAQPHDFF